MEIRFDGIKLFYNDGTIINERVQVKISYLTALLFIDGNHITSYYAQECSIEMLARFIKEDCAEYDIELSKEECQEIAIYIKNKMPQEG